MKNLFIVLIFIAGFLPKALSQTMGSKSITRVLVVGISDYQDDKITDLKFAHKDAEAFVAYMKSEAGGSLSDDKIRILKNDEASTAQIYSALDWLLDESKKKDKVIIYFSGHGDVETKTIRQRGYLLAHDTPANNYRVGAVRLEDLNDVLATLAQVNEAQIILITDACHSGNLAGNSIKGTQATATALTTQFANEVKIMSCQANEFSLEGLQWGGGRGVFSYHLIEGLMGLADKNDDGQVNLREIERYLEDKVSEEAAPQSQVPMTVGDKNARVAIVDEVILANLIAEKEVARPEMSMTASKSLNLEFLNPGDSSIVELYADFTKALENKYFLPSDIDDSEIAGKSASELFDVLSQEQSLQPVHNIMKRDFAAALQDVAQQAIIDYLEADQEVMLERWKNYGASYKSNPAYLSKAADLLGEEHYMYQQILAKQYYFEGLIIRLTAEQYKTDSLYQVAFEQVMEALHFDDQAAYIYNELGLIRQRQRQFKEAVSYYDAAMAMAPTWVLPPNNLCGVYKMMHEYEKAEQMGLKAIELKPDYYQVYFNLAMVYEGEKEYSKAKNMYKKALEIKPSYSLAANNLGTLYLKEGDTDQAKSIFEKAVQKDPEYYYLRYNLGKIFLDTKDYKNAEIHFEKAFEIDPNDKELCDNLGYVYFKTEQNDLAESFFLKALAIDLSFERAFEDLRRLYFKTKKWDAAEKLLLNWMKIKPENGIIYYNLACVKSIQGQIPEGLEYLEQSFKKGYKNLDNIQSDPDIENLRATENYEELLKKYF